MNELTQYLLKNIIFDFDGEVNSETVRSFLRRDDSAEALKLMQRVVEDGGIEDLLLALADCLISNLETGINPDVIREHLNAYTES